MKGGATYCTGMTVRRSAALAMDNINLNSDFLSTQQIASNPSFDFLSILNNNFSSADNEFFGIYNASPYDDFYINCTYSAVQDCLKTSNHLTIISINIQSINSKFNDLKEFIFDLSSHGCQLDVIYLQELWQFDNNSAFNIPGFSPLIYKLRSNNTQGGGIGMYVKTGINFVIDNVHSVFHDRIFESLFIELSCNNCKYFIGSLYRPGPKHPSLSIANQNEYFLDLFSNLLANLSDSNIPSFLFGDLNYDLLKYGSCRYVTNYIDTMFSHGFIQTITLPTRCVRASATLIDHCITNCTNNTHKSQIITSLMSDHFPILYTVSSLNFKRTTQFSEGRDFSESNISKFLESFRNIGWDQFYHINCANSAFELFSENFLTLYNIYFPLRKKKIEC